MVGWLHLFTTVDDAQKLFNVQNTSHSRQIIALPSDKILGDETFCHVIPGSQPIYYYCGFRKQNLFVDVQASVNTADYHFAWKLIELYAKNVAAGGAPIPSVPVLDNSIARIQDKAIQLKDNNLAAILSELKLLRDLVKEQQSEIKYLHSLTKDLVIRSTQAEEAINNFITYGVDENTKKLGAGERAAVMHSYKSAFDKLPETEAELTDAIKIANGRWPSEESATAEARAIAEFKKIYGREHNLKNPHDDAAVTIMAYGLRQRAENRNLRSEARGILTFKSIYGRAPTTTEDWNIVQAITYSGAKR